MNLQPIPGKYGCVTIFVRYNQTEHKHHVHMNSTVRELRKSFCKQQKLKLSIVRFLIDGVRINDKEKAKNMKHISIVEWRRKT